MTGDLLVAPLRDEIHVWTAELDGVAEGRMAESHALPPDELDRAGRLRFERGRRHFVVAHSALRHLLAGYLGIDPASLPLVSSSRGKPRLATTASRWLCFNMSHSENLAVFVVGRDREVGVDVEHLREDFDIDALLHRVLTVGERRAVCELAPGSRRLAFYRFWVRKEACLKAMGDGLAVVPNELDVTGDYAKLVTLDEPVSSSGPCSTWSLHDTDLAPGYVAAIAVEGALTTAPELRGSVAQVLRDARPKASGPPTQRFENGYA